MEHLSTSQRMAIDNVGANVPHRERLRGVIPIQYNWNLMCNPRTSHNLWFTTCEPEAIKNRPFCLQTNFLYFTLCFKAEKAKGAWCISYDTHERYIWIKWVLFHFLQNTKHKPIGASNWPPFRLLLNPMEIHKNGMGVLEQNFWCFGIFCSVELILGSPSRGLHDEQCKNNLLTKKKLIENKFPITLFFGTLVTFMFHCGKLLLD